jgi:hypothetical protein
MSTIWDENGNIVDQEELDIEDTALIVEALIMDTLSNEEIEMMLENYTPDFYKAVDEEIVQERSIVRLDKTAKLSKATRVAEYNMAKKQNDPLFKKLMTLWAAERYITDKLHQRYGMKAKTEAKKAMAQAARSKSNVMQKVMNKAKKTEGRIEASERRARGGLNGSGVEGAMKNAMNMAGKIKK